jgi:DNA polymerase (family X)
MKPDDIMRQHREIDKLRSRFKDIKIMKGIETDILADGSLDYPPEILSEFDFVVASIHTGMDMDREAMTQRIVKALRNPYTTIFAHPTGRIILSRAPYNVDMDVVIQEALRNKVALELNANPLRLDLDWRLIEPFVSRGGVIALSPDAHAVEGLDDMEYGVRVARKGFLTSHACLNNFEIEDVRLFVKKI